MTDLQLNSNVITKRCRRTVRGRVSMGNAGIIITAVHWWHRLRDPAPGSIAALLVALLAAARSGEAVTLNPGDILVNGFVQVIGSEQAAIIRLNPIDGKSTVVAQGDKLVFPSGIAIALDGDLLVADGQGGRSSSGGRVIRVNPADPNLATNQTVVSPPPGGNSPTIFANRTASRSPPTATCSCPTSAAAAVRAG